VAKRKTYDFKIKAQQTYSNVKQLYMHDEWCR
jgi:hypothetical protein